MSPQPVGGHRLLSLFFLAFYFLIKYEIVVKILIGRFHIQYLDFVLFKKRLFWLHRVRIPYLKAVGERPMSMAFDDACFVQFVVVPTTPCWP